MIFAHWFVVFISNSKKSKTTIFFNWCDFVKNDKTKIARKCFEKIAIIEMNFEITISKILSKLKNMYIKYQNTREKIEFTNWNFDVNEHKHSFEDEKHIAKTLTIESRMFNMCFWYYIYDFICFDLFTIIFSIIFETNKSIRIDLIFTQQSQQSQLSTKIEIETQMRDSQIEIEFVVVDDEITNDEKQKNEKKNKNENETKKRLINNR